MPVITLTPDERELALMLLQEYRVSLGTSRQIANYPQARRAIVDRHIDVILSLVAKLESAV